MSITRYNFPANPSAHGYCVFPQHLESEDLVLFHATPSENYKAIIEDGFKADPKGSSGLTSVSFAWKSSAALAHAMGKRESHPGDWCIFAVRYRSISRQGLTWDTVALHDYTLAPPPEVIGYCIVPETFVFV